MPQREGGSTAQRILHPPAAQAPNNTVCSCAHLQLLEGAAEAAQAVAVAAHQQQQARQAAVTARQQRLRCGDGPAGGREGRQQRGSSLCGFGRLNHSQQTTADKQTRQPYTPQSWLGPARRTTCTTLAGTRCPPCPAPAPASSAASRPLRKGRAGQSASAGQRAQQVGRAGCFLMGVEGQLRGAQARPLEQWLPWPVCHGAMARHQPWASSLGGAKRRQEVQQAAQQHSSPPPMQHQNLTVAHSIPLEGRVGLRHKRAAAQREPAQANARRGAAPKGPGGASAWQAAAPSRSALLNISRKLIRALRRYSAAAAGAYRSPTLLHRTPPAATDSPQPT